MNVLARLRKCLPKYLGIGDANILRTGTIEKPCIPYLTKREHAVHMGTYKLNIASLAKQQCEGQCIHPASMHTVTYGECKLHPSASQE